MKFLLLTLLFFTKFLVIDSAIDDELYKDFVRKLSRDQNLIDDYSRWSTKLFTQKDYTFSRSSREWNCPTEFLLKLNESSQSVHQLHINDVQCIASLGDSFVTGLGAQAIAPLDLLIEKPGISWLIGGDYIFPKFISFPNILKLFNPSVVGFSSRNSFSGSGEENQELNFASSNWQIEDLKIQTRNLIDRLKLSEFCHPKNDWKMINVFLGTNDACSSCFNESASKNFLSSQKVHVEQILSDFLTSDLERVFINLIPSFDIRILEDLAKINPICGQFHQKLCPCASLSTGGKTELLDEILPKLADTLNEFLESGLFDQRDDFAVVIQPFLTKMKLPRNENGQIDPTYFSPDCFHWSVKGHSHAAISFWNNLFEPIAEKHNSWRQEHSLKCPTQYIFTRKNSINAKTKENTKKSMDFSDDDSSSSKHNSKSEKKEKISKRSKFFLLVGLLSVVFLILIFAMGKKAGLKSAFANFNQRRFHRFRNSQEVDENDDDDIWDREKIDSNVRKLEQLPKTHGTRLDLE